MYFFVNNLSASFFNFSMVLGLFNSAIPYKDQQYSKLKSQCVSKGELFVDHLFPPSSKSLFYSKVEKDIVWKRPGVSYCLHSTSRKSINSQSPNRKKKCLDMKTLHFVYLSLKKM